MVLRWLYRFFLILWLISSAGVFLWGIWPSEHLSQDLLVVGDTHRLRVTWPGAIRSGDQGVIGLHLEPVAGASLEKTGRPASREVIGMRSQTSGAPDAPHVLAEARLEMTGVLVSPGESISQPVLPGKRLAFEWTATPTGSGKMEGVLWLHLRFFSLPGGTETEMPVLARKVTILAVDLFSLGGPTARALGALGFLTGILLGFGGIFAKQLKFAARRPSRMNDPFTRL